MMTGLHETLDHAELAPLSWIQNLRLNMGTIVQLFKLRIVALLLLASLGGALLGAGGWPGIGPIALLLLSGGMAASGASALNQYIERESDKAMRRTRLRPLASGMIAHPVWILAVGTLLIAVPVLLILPSNPALSLFLLLGALIYVLVYTVWLKPRTTLNIVIGGAAGSAAVLSGGAAVMNWQTPAVIILALLLFLWTPAHFWSLALLCRQDYRRAGVPMLPARIRVRHAAFWILLHTLGTGSAAVLLGLVPTLSWLYWLPAILATAALMRRCLRLVRHPVAAHARALFIASNLYLMLILLLICADTLISPLL